MQAKYAEMNILPILESCTLSGSFSTLAENDHLMRSYPISVYYEDMLFPSLALQALRLKFNEKVIDLNSKGFVRLNYYKRNQYNIVSFLDVVEGNVKAEYFKDKLVILGMAEIGTGDMASTPIGALYGPLLHYTFISNLLEDHLIKEPKFISALLVIFMALVPLILVLLMKKILHRVLLYLTIYLIVYGVVRYLFVANMIYIDLFYPLLSILIAAATIEAVAFNIQEQGGRFLRNAFSSYLAARVEGLTKNYGVNILITEFTVEKISKDFIYRKIEPVKVKGKDEAVLLYELMGLNEESKTIQKLYTDALDIYIDGDLNTALKLFETLVEKYDDGPSKYFIKRIEEKHPWGVNVMKTK